MIFILIVGIATMANLTLGPAIMVARALREQDSWKTVKWSYGITALIVFVGIVWISSEVPMRLYLHVWIGIIGTALTLGGLIPKIPWRQRAFMYASGPFLLLASVIGMLIMLPSMS